MNDIESYKQLMKERSALYDYRDYNTKINYSGESKLSDDDKVIDVIVREYGHYNFETDLFEVYDDTAIEFVVEDKDGNVRQKRICYYEPSEWYPHDVWEEAKKHDRKPTYEELDNFYRTTTNEKYFSHLTIDTRINVQQAIDMLEILIKKRKEISFEYCNDSLMIKTILGISDVFDSKNAKPIMLLNEFLGKSDEAPNFTNMLERAAEELEEQKISEGLPAAPIIQFPEQTGFDNNGDLGEEKQGEIIEISSFKRR